ncbi:zinc-dependent alcohol dehydrogenase family protein [Nocardia sp. NBC_00508]|uniref:zinc-dependent alcohol dehydrogenase family protein n=1 Tax=Nocardia sp. NBC_00508 TaxID=2975992 RepID=UPI002E814895|nr:zinc-dependent alcohol dehydrogenase family protein [Nocardia sp. NBC_00508]WUD65875.1 zinc-dependent alcohol dehydrogenase family protein [Nocardia sp. NBC_00508]
MRAAVLHGPRDVRIEQVPDPRIERPTDAIVRVVAACVCGSDLWSYRGIQQVPEPTRMGHEFVGVVEEIGAEIDTVRPGQFVIAPMHASDGICVHCRNRVPFFCPRRAHWGATDEYGLFVDGGQGEAVRVPMADGTLVALPEQPDPALIPDLLALCDVMGTGYHAALCAGVTRGSTVAVVGDGAVGLCAVLAVRRLGAERVIAMSSHAERQKLARVFGASDVVTKRGADGAAQVVELLGGVGADAVLECVGTKESLQQAIDATRPGGRVGYVGLPHGSPELPVQQLFLANISVRGGLASSRDYITELLPSVLDGSIEPGRVFDLVLDLDAVAGGYAAMDQRRSIKALLRP